MQLIKVISTTLDDVKRRLVKYLRFGVGDVQESVVSAPFGIDSNPIPEMVAIYAQTTGKGDTVVVGFINKELLADVGETRLFSTNDAGALQTYIHLKNDGNMEIGGASDNMVRFSELKAGFDQLKSDVNSHITNWNAFATAYVPGGPAAPGLPPTATTSSSSSASVDSSKIDEIKTI